MFFSSDSLCRGARVDQSKDYNVRFSSAVNPSTVSGLSLPAASPSLDYSTGLKQISCGLIDVMMMKYFLPLLTLLLIPHLGSPAQPTPRSSGNRKLASDTDRAGEILHRSKRGWMWNQFYLMEEYTANEYQYVGKVRQDYSMWI